MRTWQWSRLALEKRQAFWRLKPNILWRVFPMVCASARTPADESNDRTTLDRALDERLVLIVKPKPGAEWRLPESAWEVRFCHCDGLQSRTEQWSHLSVHCFFSFTTTRCRNSCCQAGETIRQAAERTAEQVLLKTATWKGQRDDVAQLHFVGNCPAGWFWRTADEEQGRPKGTFGDKVN